MRMRIAAVTLATSLTAVACGGAGDESIVLYTSVTQATVDAVVAAFAEELPDVEVRVFRAPTGEVNARIAAERVSGGIDADVLWMTDPLSMFAYDDEGILADADPDGVERLPEAFTEERFWGTRALHMVVVHRPDVAVRSWQDLANPDLAVALPDPAFAGSAFAALGYLATAPGLGFGFLESLHANGAAQVPAPGDVVTGVAEGRFDAGVTLDSSARTAEENGSPVTRVWPGPGAITFSSPIGLVEGGAHEPALAFVEFVLSDAGQRAIGETGWIPAVPGTGGPEPLGPEVFPDWEALSGAREDLLARYEELFGS